jgi:hypothetical protein
MSVELNLSAMPLIERGITSIQALSSSLKRPLQSNIARMPESLWLTCTLLDIASAVCLHGASSQLSSALPVKRGLRDPAVSRAQSMDNRWPVPWAGTTRTWSAC